MLIFEVIPHFPLSILEKKKRVWGSVKRPSLLLPQSLFLVFFFIAFTRIDGLLVLLRQLLITLQLPKTEPE